MTTTQKIIVGVVAGGVFIALILLMVSSSTSDFAVLYSSLPPEDAGRIVEYLKESGVKYKLSSGGSTVMAPSDSVYELRMELASKGFPQGAGAGFELFDRTNFGATDFTQKVNYTRALQGELARTILALNPVELARVHIVIPEERLFSEQQRPTTASIVLKLKPGAYILDAQVRGVVNLVASAVQGLSPESITVVDTDGNMMWRGGGANMAQGPSTGAMTTAQLEAKMSFEQEMQRRVETMLDRALGIGKAVVRVYADINFDSTERASEIYQPVAGGLGIPIAEQTTEEQRRSDGPAVGGVAGTPSNVEGYPIVTGAAGSKSDYTRTDRTINYEVSKVVEKAVIAPGKVERISVAAMVDGVLTQDKQETIKQVISAAVGIRTERGDEIAVTGMEFARGASDIDLSEAEADAAKIDRRAFIMRLVKIIAPIILGLLVLVFALSFLRFLRSRPDYAPEQAVGRRVDEVLAQELPPVALSAEQQKARDDEKRRAEVRQSVETLARTKPQDAAKILETWMAEE
ncbi:MAG TPA: flagellar M-ring protein FliF [Firmicutes bacterium]|nr:flagellar M-ring protein FliF [Bacillota bacterium]